MKAYFRNCKTDKNQARIIEILRRRGFQVVQISRPFDLLIAKDGKMWLGEVKDPKKEGHKNEFTDTQKKFLASWQGPKIQIFRIEEDAVRFTA